MNRVGGCASVSILAVLASMIILAPPAVVAEDIVFTVPESELLYDSEFGARAWGPGTLASRTDGPGASVDFAFTGLGSSGTGVKDNYPVDAVYGQVIPSHGNGDFSNFTGYALRVENLDEGGVWIQLCMNTGFTGASGIPPSDLTNNTFWTSRPAWTYVGPGEDVLLILDFDGTIAWQISDNKAPHTGGGLGWPDGDVYTINEYDRSEVSAIGFEVADFSASNPNATIRLTPVAATASAGKPRAGSDQPPVILSVMPNPSSRAGIRVASVRQSHAGATPGSVCVFDVSGRRVVTLWAGNLGASGLDLCWDGRREDYETCAPGLYFVVFEAADCVLSRPLILIR